MIRLYEVANSLHFEDIFIRNELNNIKNLNSQVKSQAEKLTHTFWIARQQYLHLQKLNNCMLGNLVSWQQHSNVLESIQFVESCRDFECHVEYLYNSLLQNFITKPSLVATCLAFGEENKVESTKDVAHIIMLCCYGNSFLIDDYKQLLELIETLFVLQYVYNQVPKSLNHDDTVFVVVFKLFVEFLLNGKVFLTSALHQPLMEVVKKDHLLLETNQHKLITRLTPDEIEQRFGPPAGPNFEKNIKEHLIQSEIVLMEISLSVITGLLSALSSFPPSLGSSSDARARTICMDLLLSGFICPAIVNPEQYGIIQDIVISESCRFNLMQISETLRSRTLFEESKPIDGWVNVITASLQLLIDTIVSTYDSPSVPHLQESLIGWSSSAVMLAPYQLLQLILFLETINSIDAVGIDQAVLDDLLSRLPKSLPPCLQNAVNWNLVAAAETQENEVLPKDDVMTPSHTTTPANTTDSLGEIVLVIPLDVSETSADKRLGLLSEAEVLCLEGTPKDSDRKNNTRTSHNPGRQFSNKSSDLKRFHSQSSKENEDNHFVETKGEKYAGVDSSTTSELDSDDELFEYQANPEIPARFASVVKINQSLLNDKLTVCLIESENKVEETAFMEEGCLEDTRIEPITSPDHTFNDNRDGEATASTEDQRDKSCYDTHAFPCNHPDNYSPVEIETVLQKAANKLINNSEHYSSNSSLGSGNIHLSGIAEAPADEQMPIDGEELKQKQATVREEKELNSIETRSRMKVEQLLGITLEDGDSEWDSKLVSTNRSRNKAEQILGVKLVHEDIKKKQHTFRRATSQNHKADAPSSPRKMFEGNTWRNFKRRAVSTMTKRSTINSEKNFIEMRSGSAFGNRSNFKLRRSSTEVTAGDEVMQKYADIQALRRLKSVDCDLGAAHRSSPQSDSQSIVASDSDRTSSGISNPLDTDSHTGVTALSTEYSSSSTLPYNNLKDEAASPCHTAATLTPKTHISNNDLTQIKSFVMKKLRVILSKYPPPSQTFPSTVDLYIADSPLYSAGVANSDSNYRLQLLSHFQTLLARSRLMHDHVDHVMLVEVVRCVQMMNEKSCRSVIESLWEDYQGRVQYIAYLVRSRQQLLALLSYLRTAIDGLQREKAILRRNAILQNVRSFLKRNESDLVEFQLEFEVVASDEKVSLINEFLSSLYGRLVECSTWKDADTNDLAEAESVIERHVFDSVHALAMFPNGDADLERDTMFQNLISRLSATVTPQHPSLQIPDKYLIGYPWSEAQSQAQALTIYRSPKDKLQAAVRCCKTVLHLLQLADEHAPASDDMIPVLLFVLIKANPPHLLSTKQYIDDFIGENLHGQDGYLWIMFKSALVYIQTFSTS